METSRQVQNLHLDGLLLDENLAPQARSGQKPQHAAHRLLHLCRQAVKAACH